MKKLFDELSFKVSKKTTQKYSTSFSLGILSLSPKIRPGIYAIYAYVRLADEIVDSFHGYDKPGLLEQLKNETLEAIQRKISINPILHAFQETYRKYEIPWELVELFLDSMEMDLHTTKYKDQAYKNYILGSAEVVGLMCLQVFVNGDKEAYERLKPFAMKLGSAFQKVNFLRDMKEDYDILGRTYFPEVDMENFSHNAKACIEREIDLELKEALTGIKQLPLSSKFGVFLAYTYYKSLFEKIKKTPAKRIMSRRIRINNGKKLSLMMSSYVKYKMQWV